MASRTVLRSTVVAALTVLALTASMVGSASAAEPYRCDPDVYFELDAHGFVTSYPAARCTGSDTFKSITIDSTLAVDGNLVDIQSSKYSNRPAGVYPGRGSSARNGAGNNAFCAVVTVNWSHALSLASQSSTSRNCVYY